MYTKEYEGKTVKIYVKKKGVLRLKLDFRLYRKFTPEEYEMVKDPNQKDLVLKDLRRDPQKGARNAKGIKEVETIERIFVDHENLNLTPILCVQIHLIQ